MTAQEWTDRTMAEEYPERLPDGSYVQRPDVVRRRCDELRTDDEEVHWIPLPPHEQTGTKTKYITHKYLVDHGREDPAEGKASRYIGSMVFRSNVTYENVMGAWPPLRVVPDLVEEEDPFADVRVRLQQRLRDG